ncbi:MAG: hypothetical protein R2787_06730 [Saprospiraceae bacterium]
MPPSYGAVGDTDLNVYSDYALDSLVVWLKILRMDADYLTTSRYG